MVSEPQTPYHATTESTPEDLGKLIKQTTDVLLSNTKYGKALKENIEAFHEAVNERKKISDPSGAAGGSKAAKKRAAQ